jgi:hypothetical protein
MIYGNCVVVNVLGIQLIINKQDWILTTDLHHRTFAY